MAEKKREWENEKEEKDVQNARCFSKSNRMEENGTGVIRRKETNKILSNYL